MVVVNLPTLTNHKFNTFTVFAINTTKDIHLITISKKYTKLRKRECESVSNTDISLRLR